MILNKQSKGRDTDKPHNIRTENAAPILAMKMTEVTCSLSVRLPMITVPKTDVALKSATVTVPATADRPSERAYVGSHMFGIL